MGPRVIVLGWDSATFDVVDPLLEAGRLPALEALAGSGFRAPLRSTWPPMTDCAWTSAFTGVNPGAHGIFGSWYRAPGSYGYRYFSSRDRRAPAAWELARDARWLVWNVPMTYPPSKVNGAMVAGYGAPPGSRWCEPAALQERLAERWPVEDLLDRAPRGSLERFLDELVRGLDAQAQALPWAAREVGADCVAAVWPHVDRAQHFFWRFRGTDHPLAGAVDDVYVAMDRATGAVVEAFPDADVLVVSDHGAGPLRSDLDLASWLVDEGHAALAPRRRAPVASLAWKLPPAVRTVAKSVAPGLARRAFGATLAGQLAPFEWGRTKAFFGVHGDLWLNLEGREPRGCVRPEVASALIEEIGAALAELADPRTGAPVVEATHRRDSIYSGAAIELAPDAIVDTWTRGYRVAPGRAGDRDVFVRPASLTGVDEAWSADHRPLGIFVAGGPRVARGAADELRLYDVAPTMLALLETRPPGGLDGVVAKQALDPLWLRDRDLAPGEPARERTDEAAAGYSDEEAASVAAHLKDLGYIE